MKIFRLIWTDIKIDGILKKRYVVLVLLCGFYCYIFQVFVYNLESIYCINKVNLGDLIAFVHCGTVPGIRMIQQNEFPISLMWLTLLMVQLFLPLDYPVSTMEKWGYPYVMKSGRKQWWLAKCIYTLIINLIGMFLEIGTFTVYCWINGLDIELQCNNNVSEIIFGSVSCIRAGTLSLHQSILLLIVLPILGIVTMSQMLLLISIILGRIVSYTIGVAWLIASVFIAHPLLPGNCTMVIRSNMIDTEGMCSTIQVFFCLGIIFFSIYAGVLMIQHKDFYTSQRNKELWE